MNKHISFENKHILITGGTGFIGSHLARKFLSAGAFVHVFDNLSTGRLENLPRHTKLLLHHGSIMHRQKLVNLPRKDFEVIFHLASIVGMKLATKHHQIVYETATEGTENVLRAIPESPVVLFSSSAVYGLHQTKPVSESSVAPFDELLQYDGGKLGYACGKFEMEQIGKRYAEDGRKVLIIRPFNVVGRRQLGDYGMVIPTFINQAISGKPLTIFDDGSQVRSFSCIQTFVRCLTRLMEHQEVWLNDKNIVNIGTGKGNTINALAGLVLQETGSKSALNYKLYSDHFADHRDVTYRLPITTHGERYYGKTHWPSLRCIIRGILKSMRTRAIKTTEQVVLACMQYLFFDAYLFS